MPMGQEHVVDEFGQRQIVVDGDRIAHHHVRHGRSPAGEEREPEHRPAWIELEHRRCDRPDPDRLALLDPDRALANPEIRDGLVSRCILAGAAVPVAGRPGSSASDSRGAGDDMTADIQRAI